MIKLDRKIVVKGARSNNLKNITVEIPLQKFVVITGVSGSGKSSLAYDTLFVEGQRRYVESLSSYARQFLNRMNKPDVDFISNIPPTIAIKQKINNSNPRSTVGISTEIHEYFKLLFARIGKTISPFNLKEVKKHKVKDVLDFICTKGKGENGFIGFEPSNELTISQYIKQGYSRVFFENNFAKLEILEDFNPGKYFIVVDRFDSCEGVEMLNRLADSIEIAFFEGHGSCVVGILNDLKWYFEYFSNRFESGGVIFEEPHSQMFNFNSPAGACPTCEGFGQTIGIDEDLVVPDKSLSVYDDAVACWRGETMQEWKWQFINNSHIVNFPVHKPYFELTYEEKEILWRGTEHFHGINDFFEFLQSNLYKIQYRVLLSRYRGKTLCPVCKGKRLKLETEYVKVCGKSLGELLMVPLFELKRWLDNLQLPRHDYLVAERLIIEIKKRLEYLIDSGLGYLTLNRSSSTLSGGESQRIHLATSLGSGLVGSLYILDEPSVGLHSHDTKKLITILKKLRDMGNTVVVVEHDEEIIREADYIIDMGPLAGKSGGEIVYQGSIEDMRPNEKSLTSLYLTKELYIEVPKSRKKWNKSIIIKGAHLNNLKNINVEFPLYVMTCVTGVSGSGKSTLVQDILYLALQKKLSNNVKTSGYNDLVGDVEIIKNVVLVDQSHVGRSTRSNAVTYLKIYDDIRQLYSEQNLAKRLVLKPFHFSFNVEGGRCEECKGEGYITVEMQFLADIKLVCETCNGKRFKQEVLEVEYKGKSIYDLLQLTVDEAIEFFNDRNNAFDISIKNKLMILKEVGLGYLPLGQSTSLLSGGEIQRLKLASFLSHPTNEHTLFIFDEPTTGLHKNDVKLLLKAFNKLLENYHTIIVIEHNLDVIKHADWVIDLGPGAGNDGGNVVEIGIPEKIAKSDKSVTGWFFKNVIEKIE